MPGQKRVHYKLNVPEITRQECAHAIFAHGFPGIATVIALFELTLHRHEISTSVDRDTEQDRGRHGDLHTCFRYTVVKNQNLDLFLKTAVIRYGSGH